MIFVCIRLDKLLASFTIHLPELFYPKVQLTSTLKVNIRVCQKNGLQSNPCKHVNIVEP